MATLTVIHDGGGVEDCPHEHLGNPDPPSPNCWPVTTCCRCHALVVHDVPDHLVCEVAEAVRRQLEGS